MRSRTLLSVLFAVTPWLAGAGSLPDGPYVSTSASAIHDAEPDYAVIAVEYRTVAESAEIARAETHSAQEELLAALAEYPDSLRDTNLEALRFGREYEYDRQQQKRVEAGFFGQFSFLVEVSDFDRLSKLHYQLAAMDWNRLGEPEFKVADTDAAANAARQKALARATAQARALAEAGGSALGEAWGIIFEPMHELAGRSPGVTATEMRRVSVGVATAEAEFAIPMMPRPVEFEARVGVVYRLMSGGVLETGLEED